MGPRESTSLLQSQILSESDDVSHFSSRAAVSEWWLTFLSNWGQLLAGGFALIAAAVGILASYASVQLTRKSNDQLVVASQIIKRLERQVGTVIGGEWMPLTASQIEELRVSIVPWPRMRIQVMYENEFGKAFAESIATAFRAANWDVKFSSGAGFGQGIEVGPGPNGLRMKEAIGRVTGLHNIRNLRADEPEHGIRFVGVGAKVDQP